MANAFDYENAVDENVFVSYWPIDVGLLEENISEVAMAESILHFLFHFVINLLYTGLVNLMPGSIRQEVTI